MTIVAIGLTGIYSAAASAEDECTGFKWDVSKEHALFGGKSVTLMSGKDPATAPTIDTNHLYLVQLAPQSEVQFAAGPEKRATARDAFAGLVMLRIEAAGDYRVSVDVPLWIDVVADAKPTPPVDYQGQRDCSAPHKIVEFDLAGGTSYVLQVSGSATTNVRLAVTPAPLRKT